ncbi:MAG TPA: DUF2071 domain-containing protein [Candidatus Angelobacter sp.]
MNPLLRQTAHRPFPLPRAPWIMVQQWHDLLFAHWALAPEQVRHVVPKELELDLFDGKAYVAVAPFRMSGIRARWCPPVPGLSRLPELNVRTYVRYGGIPGVYFFSLDAGSLPAVWGARAGYGLPYFHAKMSVNSAGSQIEYASRRLQDPHPAEFRGRYWPTSEPRQREKGSIEYFLTERYCLYVVRSGKVSRAVIHHLPWQLQDAEAEIELNTMAQAAGIELPESKPLLHFSRFLKVLVWWPEECG